MANLTLTELDDRVVDGLAQLARFNHVTMEDQAKALLASAVAVAASFDRRAAADRIAALTARGVVQTDSTLMIREDRDR